MLIIMLVFSPVLKFEREPLLLSFFNPLTQLSELSAPIMSYLNLMFDSTLGNDKLNQLLVEKKNYVRLYKCFLYGFYLKNPLFL